jgi:hypothetical protein
MTKVIQFVHPELYSFTRFRLPNGIHSDCLAQWIADHIDGSGADGRDTFCHMLCDVLDSLDVMQCAAVMFRSLELLLIERDYYNRGSHMPSYDDNLHMWWTFIFNHIDSCTYFDQHVDSRDIADTAFYYHYC